MPKPTWERLSAAKRDVVLKAAEAEFDTHGYIGASVNTICREAGISKGSLFQYFTDKSDLFVYVINLAAQRIRAAVEAKIAELPFEDDYMAAVDELVGVWVEHFYDNHRDRTLTAAVNLEHDPQALAASRAVVNDHYCDVVGALVDIGIALGHLRADVDRDGMVAIFIALLPHMALSPHISGLDPVLGNEGASRAHAVACGQRIVRLFMEPYLTQPARPIGAPRPRAESTPG